MISTRIQVGDRIPHFRLPDQNGEMVDSANFIGQNLVIYFYPKDNTLGCTAEACAFRDQYSQFADAGATVIGISSDSVDSHHFFASQYSLPFILLSDLGGKLRKTFGVPYAFGFIPGRITYVVDKEGTVKHIYNSQMNFSNHSSEALQVIKEIKLEHAF